MDIFWYYLAFQGEHALFGKDHQGLHADQNKPHRRQFSLLHKWDRLQAVSPMSTALSFFAMLKTWRRGNWIALPLLSAVFGTAGISAATVPGPPSRVDLEVVNGEEVTVSFSAPLSDGGSSVQSYEVRADATILFQYHCT